MTDTWVDYFKDGSLDLTKVNKIFRTTNALENYNRIFKNLKDMKPNMQFTLYVDNIINEINYHKIDIEEKENLPRKKIKATENTSINNNKENELNKEDEINYENILNNFFNFTDNDNLNIDIKDNTENINF